MKRMHHAINQFSLFFLIFVGTLALSRITFEFTFPRWLWLGHPIIALPIVAVLTVGLWLIGSQRLGKRAVNLAPLLLNFIYLSDPAVDLVKSRLIFGASIWLCGVLFVFATKEQRGGAEARRDNHQSRADIIAGVGFVLLALVPVYLLTVSHLVGRDDTFEFQVVAPKLGIAHPTGYPLYLLLGRLFTLLPFGSVAWRLNFGSIVYASLAGCLLFVLLYRWWKRPLPAILTAVSVGLSLTLWSQAIVAEVYALNALMVVGVLFLILEIKDWEIGRLGDWGIGRLVLLLAGVLGLGMANHVTTVFLLPPALLAVYWAWRKQDSFALFAPRFVGKALACGLLPLLLYAYLPLRWQAVNNEPMGWQRFVDWVIGGRFQDALQWQAWLNDPTRFEIVGRLFLDNWGWFNLIVALIGLAFLLICEWKTAVILLLIFISYSFYCLNYYVPDLAVFLIPAQLMIGIFWGYAFKVGLSGDQWQLRLGKTPLLSLKPIFLVLFLLPLINSAVSHWRTVDQSADDGRTLWGTAVLSQPLTQNAAILADSDKFPQLFYLQQSEGIREDLDISVWPDEAAYRQQLDSRLSAGQTVYLARFLPGLEAIYHLNSVGPLIHVGTAPQTALPTSATPTDLQFGDITLRGYALEPQAEVAQDASAVTLFWQAETAVSPPQHVYVRWQGFDSTAGQHPANNFYPTVAWKGNEIVADYHEWPYPIVTEPQTVALQVALGAPFSAEDGLEWQTVTAVELTPNFSALSTTPLRMRIGDLAVDGLQAPTQVRPLAQETAVLTGYGDPHFASISLTTDTTQRPPQTLTDLVFSIGSAQQAIWVQSLSIGEENGRFQLTATHPDGVSCGWMQIMAESCVLSSVMVSGVALPEGAINYEDKIALLNADLNTTTLTPGGTIDLTIEWQALATIEKDYTVFIQLLSEGDQIVGQIDSWPLQGTLPTSQWQPGQQISDPYRIPLSVDMPPGTYKIQVGFYLLETFRRLPTFDTDGNPTGDSFIIQGLIVPQE